MRLRIFASLLNRGEGSVKKEFMQVDAIWHKDGSIEPVKVYHDGRGYKVKMMSFVNLEATKAGGCDLKYIVLLNRRMVEIYLEAGDSYTSVRRWYSYQN